METGPVHGRHILEAVDKRVSTTASRASKWSCPSRNFAIGDIVLVVDNSAPCNSWVMGKVIQTVPDEFGLIHQVCITTITNSSNGKEDYLIQKDLNFFGSSLYSYVIVSSY